VRFLGIYGINPYVNFQSDYRINDIVKVGQQEEAVKVQEEQVNASENLAAVQIEPIVQKSVNPNEISIGINKNDDFSYIGRDKDIQNLDMKKAISDMKQDSILQEYQYFVGSAKNVFQSQDGSVIAK